MSQRNRKTEHKQLQNNGVGERAVLYSGGSSWPWGPGPIPCKILGNFKGKTPLLHKFWAQAPPWGQNSTGLPLTKILDPRLAVHTPACALPVLQMQRAIVSLIWENRKHKDNEITHPVDLYVIDNSFMLRTQFLGP